LHDPGLWHLNRRSIAGTFTVGMFVMYLPPLGQLPISAALSLDHQSGHHTAHALRT